MDTFVGSRVAKFKVWWRTPATARDRALGGLVAAFASFWLGIVGLAVFSPVAVQAPVFIGLTVGAGLLLGIAFPKAATLVLFPFTVFGGGA